MSDTGEFYFIEVNPRIQVEHTVTEVVTGFDIVESQILIAAGRAADRSRNRPRRSSEDHHARLRHPVPRDHRRSRQQLRARLRPPLAPIAPPAASGIRLDAGTAFSGAVITPFYDSLLVKVTATGLRFIDAARRMERCLQEFRVRGVKTNIPFLINLVTHPEVPRRRVDDAIPRRNARAVPVARPARPGDQAPELHRRGDRQRAPGGQGEQAAAARGWTYAIVAPSRHVDAASSRAEGTRNKFKELGPEKFAKWIREQKRLLMTDTTMRDAHQSLLATRMRTYDMLAHRAAYATRTRRLLFAGNVGRGNVRHVRCGSSRKIPGTASPNCATRMPNILFQMLLRAANAVGYTNYPGQCREARSFTRVGQAGMDVFRIFDALNWLPNMQARHRSGAQRPARSAKPRSATPATSSIRSATSTR